MSLRTRVMHGGFYLILRQGLGIIVSTVGLILLTRTIGPGAYGLFVAAFGIYSYLHSVGRWGVDVYLIRRKKEPEPQDYHQAFSLLLLVGLAGAALAILAVPFLERWVLLDGFGPIATVLFAGLPTVLLSVVPLARLERALEYRKVALVEVSGQVTIYVVAVPLAYQGLGPWAPVGGVWASQLLTLGLVYRASGYRPRLHWELSRVRSMVGYGLGFSASEWLWNLLYLVNPLVVGRYLGAEAVGQVGLALRLVDQVGSMITLPAARLSIPVFARLQEDRDQVVKALDKGMRLQLMGLGPLLAGVGLVAPWVIPLLLGSSWLPALEIYPFIALSYLVGTAFGLHSSVLFVLGKLWEVAAFRLLNLVLFAAAALLMVPHLGLIGYGLAEIVHIPSWILLLYWFRVYVGRPFSIHAGVWLIAWAVPLFGWQIGPWVWLSLTIPLIWPATRRELLQTLAAVSKGDLGRI
jgi:O-antigen/teichoic acid export membrane protein